MDDAEFDKALIGAAFALAARDGWDAVNVAAAARAADLDLARARGRFPGRGAILLRFGRLADQTALAQTPVEGSVRDRLFYLLMQRMDAMQAHRAGVLALLQRLPAEPGMAVLLSCATKRSMRWLLNAAGVSTRGVRGELRVRGLVGIWLWAMRAWQGDETEDMSATMSAVDTALQRAERVAPWLGGGTVPSKSTSGESASASDAEPDLPAMEAPSL